jgi:hypothetical protein
MLKKSLIFGSVALFLMALITLTGCPTSVDDSSSGIVYAHRIYGAAVTAYQAQEAIDRAVAAGEAVVLEDGLTIVDGGQLNFKNAQVRIDGEVSFDGGVMNVVDAAVTWSQGAELYLGTPLNLGGTSAYIHRKGLNAAGFVDPANLVEYAESLDQIMATAQYAAVRRYTLGPKADHDYSTDSSGIPAQIVAQSLEGLFILEDLTLPIDGTAPSLVDLMALGTLDVTGTRPGVEIGVTPGIDDLLLGTCSTLTSSQGGVIVYTPGTAELPNVEVQEGKNFFLQQMTPIGDLSIPGKLKGKGTLEVSSAAIDIEIAGGDGNIRFTGSAVPTEILIGSTGTVTFDNDLTGLSVLTDPSKIAGDVVFKGDVTAQDTLALLGNVTLINGKEIGFGGALTLGADKTISVRITPTAAGSVPVLAPVLTAPSGNVVLTPVGSGAALAAAPAPSRNTEEAVNGAKKITLGDDSLTINNGTLQVVPGAIFEIEDAKSLSTKLPTTSPSYEIGYLAVADTAALNFSATGGTVNIGATTVAGSAASSLKASGGTVILGNNKIAGGAAGAKLTAAAGGTNLAFSLTGSGSVLILQQVDLNLAGHGSLGIAGAGTANQVTLADQAKITLNNGEGGKATSRSKIGQSATLFATLTGDYEAVTAPTATTSQAAWSVAHKGEAYVSIIGGASAVSLSKSGTSFQ